MSEERIGAYRLEKMLGRGGMGEVWQAFDERLHRHVAIKRINARGLEKPQHRERFLREARAVARLNHPAIVQIFDILEGADDGKDCIVMELVDGETLTQRLSRGALPVAEALNIAAEISEGLGEAHGKGLVHRDLKGANVLLVSATPNPRPKILDFGLARAFRDPAGSEYPADSIEAVAESITDDGMILGTAHAMAPEQAQGRRVDHRADFFALGILLYEMLVAHSPFRAESTMATLYRVVQQPAPPMRPIRPELSAKVEAYVVERLLAKKPDDRPQSAAEISADLQKLAQSVPDDSTSRSQEIPVFAPPPSASSSWQDASTVDIKSGSAAVSAPASVAAPPAPSSSVSLSSPSVSAPPAPSVDTSPAPKRLRIGRTFLAFLAVAAFALVHFSREGTPAIRVTDWPVALAIQVEDENTAHAAAIVEILIMELGEDRVVDASDAPAASTLSVESRGAEEVELRLCSAETCGTWRKMKDEDLLGLGRDWAQEIGAEVAKREEVPLDELASEALERGFHAQRREENSSALRHFEEAVSRAAKHPLPQAARAEALNHLGHQADAREAAAWASELARNSGVFLRADVRVRELDVQRLWARAGALAIAVRSAESPDDSLRFDRGLTFSEIQMRGGYPDASRETLVELAGLADTEGKRAALALAEARIAYLDRRPDDHLEASQRALEIAVEIEAPFMQARALQVQGMALRSLGRLEEALETLDQSAQIFAEYDADQDAAGSMVERGTIFGRQGRLAEASAAFERAIRHYIEAGNVVMELRLQANRALLLQEQGELHAAAEINQNVLERMAERGDTDAVVIGWINQALILEEMSQFEEALTFHQKALDELASISHGERLRPWSMEVLGLLEMRLGRLNDARKTLGGVLERVENGGDPGVHGRTLTYLAQIDLLNGDPERAQEFLGRATKILQETAAIPDAAQAFHELGRVALEQDDLDAAQEFLEKALEMRREFGKPHDIALSRVELARLERFRGRYDASLDDLAAAIAYFQGENLAMEEGMASLEKARVRLEQGHCDLALSDLATAGELLGEVSTPMVVLPRRLAEAAVLGSCGKPEEARALLGEALITATSGGFRLWDLEIRLERARLDLASGNADAARPALDLVRKNAADATLKRLARRAGEL